MYIGRAELANGTKTEMQAPEYAFSELGMETVFADAVIKNSRSQNVLKMVEFIETHQDDSFHYYRCKKHLKGVKSAQMHA